MQEHHWNNLFEENPYDLAWNSGVFALQMVSYCVLTYIVGKIKKLEWNSVNVH